MILSNARATLGLNGTATLSAAGTSGSIQLGASNQTIRLIDAVMGYNLQAVFAGSGDALVLDLLANDTTGSTAWVSGTAQVETATCSGTVTTAGNATAIVTSSGMTGSPLTVTFAVALDDTASDWATKCRAALTANATIAERFTVSGTTTAVVLTRKPTNTFTIASGTLPIYAANDATLNIALADATSAGITEAATSTNTTAGVISDGVKIYDGDGNDIEGATVGLSAIYGVQFALTSSATCAVAGSVNDIVSLVAGEVMTKASTTALSIDQSQTFTAGGASSLAITVFGE